MPEQLPLPRAPHALVQDMFHQRRRAHLGHRDAQPILEQVQRQLQEAAADAGGELRVPLSGDWGLVVRADHG